MKNVKQYIISTYVMFYIILLFIGLMMFLLESHMIVDLLIMLSSWTSTFVFVMMFRKIYPQEKLWTFVRKQFNQRIKISTLLSVLFIQLTVLICVFLVIHVLWDISVYDQVIVSWPILLMLFGYNLILGPLGEELGWRGYVLKELQVIYSPLRSACIVGIVWGLWHSPLWFMSGYSGLQLLQYIVLFLVGIIAISIMITAFFNLNNNLLIPITIHQLFNYTIAIQVGDALNVLMVTSLLYVLVAIILIIINYRDCLYTSKQKT